MIVSTKIISNVNQSDGRQSIHVDYLTEFGDIESRSYLLTEDINAQSYAELQHDKIINSLKEKEENNLESIINKGNVDVATIISNLVYLSINDALKIVIYRGISLTSVYRLINLKSITEFTKSNYTDDQLSLLTGFTVNEVVSYYMRIDSALTCVDAINTINGSVYRD